MFDLPLLRDALAPTNQPRAAPVFLHRQRRPRARNVYRVLLGRHRWRVPIELLGAKLRGCLLSIVRGATIRENLMLFSFEQATLQPVGRVEIKAGSRQMQMGQGVACRMMSDELYHHHALVVLQLQSIWPFQIVSVSASML